MKRLMYRHNGVNRWHINYGSSELVGSLQGATKVDSRILEEIKLKRSMAGICNILCLVIITAVFTSAIAATDYCNLESCKNNNINHTMCKYPQDKPSDKCKNYKDRGLTENERKEIVQIHNELRQKVAKGQESKGDKGPQPEAAEMSNLTWDSELAKIAQRWADQCNFGHDECRNVEKYWVGQNAAITMNSAENNTPMKEFVQMWYDEVKDFDCKEVPKFTQKNFGKIGHYTQLVWGKTTNIGCGRIKWTEDDWNKQMLMCNYGPSGNYKDQPVYKTKK